MSRKNLVGTRNAVKTLLYWKIIERHVVSWARAPRHIELERIKITKKVMLNTLEV
jgi:hypothetical protein